LKPGYFKHLKHPGFTYDVISLMVSLMVSLIKHPGFKLAVHNTQMYKLATHTPQIHASGSEWDAWDECTHLLGRFMNVDMRAVHAVC
jgi:hypothetical protein